MSGRPLRPQPKHVRQRQAANGQGTDAQQIAAVEAAGFGNRQHGGIPLAPAGQIEREFSPLAQIRNPPLARSAAGTFGILAESLNYASILRNLTFGVANQKSVSSWGRKTVKALVLAALAVGLLIAADGGKDQAAKDRKMLEGTWTITSVVRNDNPLPEGKLKGARMIFRGEVYIQKLGEKTIAKGKFRLDPGKKPRTIDLTRTDGKEEKKTTFGIYELKDGVLRICGARPGQERPTELAARDGSDHTLVTLQRAKP
jgi:uncharacterized protein (TIGR03067 family)